MIHNLIQNPSLYAVIGNPIHHSLSPRIHQLFAEQIGKTLHYQTILAELDNLPSTLAEFSGRGVNITAPFKQQAVALVQTLSPAARRIKAINTVTFHADGSRSGDNTDGVGFIRDIQFNQQINLKNKRIAILGAGGAARAIIDALLAENIQQLCIVNRTVAKAEALATEFVTRDILQVRALSDLKNYSCDIIINTSSANFSDMPCSLPTSSAIYYYDIVYGYELTPFLQWAKQQGAIHYSDGLGMLIEQAAEAFYLWHGVRVETGPIAASLKKTRAQPQLT